MTESSTPEYLKELAAGYVTGDLNPEEAEAFEQLLAKNPELVIEVNHLQETLEQVLYGLNEVEPPQYLLSNIIKAADTPVSSLSPLTNKSRSATLGSRWSPLPWSKIMGSVAALLILSLGWDNYHLRQEQNVAKNVTAMLQNPETRVFSLKGTKLADHASGNIVMDIHQQRVAIVIRNLPTPPAGRVYRYWAVIDGDKVPCGQLNPSVQGVVLDKLSLPADLYSDISGLIVTLEPSQAAADPVGPVVMKSIL